MPLVTKTTDDFLGIIHIGSGLVTGDEFVHACHAAFQLVQNTQNFSYEFVDLSKATDLQIDPEHLERITERDRLLATYRPDAVVVIVAPRDDFNELARTWQDRIRDLGWKTHVSRDCAEALRWLKANLAGASVVPECNSSSNSPTADDE